METSRPAGSRGLPLRVHSLPMRNGNSSASSCVWIIQVGPQPTYEEWKQRLIDGYIAFVECPQPTYEEWKLVQCVADALQNVGPQPTYEEWKRYARELPANVVERSTAYL